MFGSDRINNSMRCVRLIYLYSTLLFSYSNSLTISQTCYAKSDFTLVHVTLRAGQLLLVLPGE